MKKVLIIEDDKDLSETLSMFLQSNNFIVYTSLDGIDGVQEALAIQPDIIICDIAMPNLDGYGVFDTLQKINSTSFIPFIFLTAKTEKKDIRTGMNLGVDDYITKPFDNYELLEAVKVRLKKFESFNMANQHKIITTLDNPINGIFITQDKRIVYSNKKLSKILGLDTEKLNLLNIEDFINEFVQQQDRINVLKYIQIASKEGANADFIRFDGIDKSHKSLKLGIFIKHFNFNKKDSLLVYIMEISFNEEEPELKIEKPDSDHLISNREKEVLLLICHGLVNKEIADKLGISKRTVDRHRDNLMKKTTSRNTAELMVNAIKLGLVEL